MCQMLPVGQQRRETRRRPALRTARLRLQSENVSVPDKRERRSRSKHHTPTPARGVKEPSTTRSSPLPNEESVIPGINLAQLGSTLAVAGALLYGILAFSYELFYSRLGIEPADVGLNYAMVLSKSSEIAICILPGIAIMVLAPQWLDRRRISNPHAH